MIELPGVRVEHVRELRQSGKLMKSLASMKAITRRVRSQRG